MILAILIPLRSLPMLGRQCLTVVLPDRTLCLPSFSHLMIVCKTLSSSFGRILICVHTKNKDCLLLQLLLRREWVNLRGTRVCISTEPCLSSVECIRGCLSSAIAPLDRSAQ